MSAHMQSDPQRLSEFLSLLAQEQRGLGARHLALVLDAAAGHARDMEEELDVLNQPAIPDVYALGGNVVPFRRDRNA